MSIHLLDVGVLVALFDPDHGHHELAHGWFADHRASGWATCAATESGFVRVMAHPDYGGTVSRLEGVVERLRMFKASGHHHFWPEEASITDLDAVRPSYMRSHRQVPDVLLLALAVRRNGRLATFDRAIPVSAVVGATRESLAVIGAPSP